MWGIILFFSCTEKVENKSYYCTVCSLMYSTTGDKNAELHLCKKLMETLQAECRSVI